MTTKKVLSAIVAIAVLSACAGLLPAPTPQDRASAGIGVLVKTRAPIKLFVVKVDSVMFVRLEGNDSSQYISTQPIASNYNKDGYIYLLNAPPGRYAAVATFRSQAGAPTAPTGGGGVTVTVNPGDTDYTTYFSRDLVKATEVTVEPGRIVFMGEVIVDTSTSFKDADDVQSHYFRLMAPGVEDRNMFLGLMSGDYHYTGTLHEVNHDDEARQKFVATTRENLGEAGWLAAVDSGTVQEQVVLQSFDEPSIEAAGDDAEILEAVDAAITVAKNHGFQYDASDSKNGRVVVKALWKDRPVTLTMRFFRKESGLYIASAMQQPGDVSLVGGGQEIEQMFYPDLFQETTRRGLTIYGDPKTPP